MVAFIPRLCSLPTTWFQQFFRPSSGGLLFMLLLGSSQQHLPLIGGQEVTGTLCGENIKCCLKAKFDQSWTKIISILTNSMSRQLTFHKGEEGSSCEEVLSEPHKPVGSSFHGKVVSSGPGRDSDAGKSADHLSHVFLLCNSFFC